jgi:hypothetical protein
MYGKSPVQSLYTTPDSLSVNALKQNTHEMWGWAGSAVVNVIVGLRIVEARHSTVSHSLWPWEKWVSWVAVMGLVVLASEEQIWDLDTKNCIK